MSRRFRLVMVVLAGLYGAFLVLPLIALVWRSSPTQFWSHLAKPQVWSAMTVSLACATVAMVVTIIGGTPLAWFLARSESRWKNSLTMLMELPLVLPPAVAGLGLILAFGRRQMLGPTLAALGIDQVALTRAAVVMAMMIVAAPLYIRSARTAFEQVPRRQEQASALLGADEAMTFWWVTCRLALPGLQSGALLTWARALGELGATLMFAGNLPGRTQTMPTAIFVLWQRDLTAAVTLSILLLVLSAAALVAARHVTGRNP